MEKKTSSTFKLVFALCNRSYATYISGYNWNHKKTQTYIEYWCAPFQKFEAILICKSLAPRSRSACIWWEHDNLTHAYQLLFADRKHEACTLLLSSISAWLPTSILLTLSDAACSMFLIQLLMSVQKICWNNWKK